MKTKIFALVISILCICTVFAACNQNNVCEAHLDENADTVCDVCEKTIEEGDVTLAPCEHKDDNADKVCELCGKAIVTMIVAPAPEEESPKPGIKPIPTDAKLEDYIRTEPLSNKLSAVKIDGDITAINDADQPRFALVRKPYGETYAAYSVVDFATGKTVIELGNTDPATAEAGYVKEIDVSLDTYCFTVQTTVTKASQEQSVKFAVYTYTGKRIGEEYSWTYNADTYTPVEIPYLNVDIDLRYEYPLDLPEYENDAPIEKAQFAYVTYGEITYVVNPESYEVIYSENKDTLVKMPIMDEIKGNYGMISYNSSIMIYDLTKWIDCIYSYTSYTASSMPISADAFFLENGKVLVQSMELLPGNAPSYDLVLYGSVKVDITTVLIDPVAKTEKEVELGYIIREIETVSDNDPIFTDKVDNVFYVYDTSNINLDELRTLIVNNDLEILCESKIGTRAKIVGSGLYGDEYYFSDFEGAIEIVDIKGEHKSYVGADNWFGYGFVRIGERFYDYSKNLIVDLDVLLEDCWVIHDDYQSFMIYGDADAVYYYAYGAKAGVAIDTDKTDFAFEDAGEYGYVISYTADGNKVYELYDADNAKLATSTADFAFVASFEYEDLSGTAYVFATYEGSGVSYYIVK